MGISRKWRPQATTSPAVCKGMVALIRLDRDRMLPGMEILPVKIRKLLPPKDDLFAVLEESLPALNDGDIVCIASKVVAIYQGRTREISNDKFQISNEKREIILREAEWVDDSEMPFLTIKNAQFVPFAGVDESNGNGYYVLWPEDPMGIAREILEFLMKRMEQTPSPYPLPRGERGKPKLGVIITDSTCLPLRHGTVGTAIGFAGFDPIRDYRGKKDLFDRTMELSRVNVADGLAAAATLAMGEGDEATPLVVIRDANGIAFTDKDHSGDVRIDPREDVFAPVLSAVLPSSPALPTVPADWVKNRPFFTLVAVTSLDGIIAPEGRKVEEWASIEDQQWFHSLLPMFDATVLGKNTYRGVDASSKRNRVVLTSSVEGIEQKDEHTWVLDPAKTDLLAFLREQGWKNVGVTGGGETYSFFLAQGWADRLLLTVEPIVFGPGVRLFCEGVEKRFQLVRTTRLNTAGTLLLQYDLRSA